MNTAKAREFIAEVVKEMARPPVPDFPSAYAAGEDARRKGLNTGNCNFCWFYSATSTEEWKRGFGLSANK